MTRPTSRIKRSCLACLGLTFSQSIWAGNEFVLQLDTALTSNSNTFRFYQRAQAAGLPENPDTPQPRPQLERETAQEIELRGVAVIPVLSEQTRLLLMGSLGQHKYKNYKQLDHRSHAADGIFEWQITPAIQGRIAYGKEDKLFQYLNGSLTELDMSHQKRAVAELVTKVANEWLLAAKSEKTELKYDLPQNKVYDLNEKSTSLALKYVSPTGSSLELGLRQGHSEFPDRDFRQQLDLDKRYAENEIYFDAEWKYSPKTQTSLHLGLLQRRYENLHERDTRLKNLIWRGTYFYSPQLRFDLQLWDRPYGIVDPAILYVTSQALRFDVFWKWSDKTRLNASLLAQNSDNLLIPRLSSLNRDEVRKERVQRIGLGLQYEIDRGLNWYLDGIYERSRRLGDGSQLTQTILKMGVNYTYESLPASYTPKYLKRYQPSYSATELPD